MTKNVKTLQFSTPCNSLNLLFSFIEGLAWQQQLTRALSRKTTRRKRYCRICDRRIEVGKGEKDAGFFAGVGVYVYV
jgi:hypothetical protein